MIIQVDQEGKEVIEMFCAMALKVGDIQNLKQVNLVLDAMMFISKPDSLPKQLKPLEKSEQSEQLKHKG